MATLHWIKNAVRAQEILRVLVRHGFWDAVNKVDSERNWIGRLAPSSEGADRSLWVRVRHVLEDLGPTFVKLGQLAATREDLLPEALVAELLKLREAVRTQPWSEMEPVIIEALGGPVTGAFRKFDTEAFAAGSLGQVYRAELADGTVVAVKIRRPGITQSVRADLEILKWLAEAAHERIPELRSYDLPTVIAESAAGFLRELDFRNEWHNAEEFNAMNENPLVFAPRVFAHLCSESVHVAAWVEGVAPGDPSVDAETGRMLAKAGGTAVFHQVLVSGFFHADLHTGNLRVTPDGRLAFLDWGLAGQLTASMRRFLAEIFSAVDAHDAERLTRVVLADPAALLTRLDSNRLESQVARVLRRHRDFSSGNGGVGALMLDLLRVFGANGLRLARDFTLLAKAVLLLENSCRALDPSFDIAGNARSFLKQLSQERRNPVRWLREIAREAATGGNALADAPVLFAKLLRRIESGAAGLVVEHKGVEGFRDTIDMAINRLVFAIIVAALLVGSSLLVQKGDETRSVWVFPSNVGVVGYILAFSFTIYLLFDIIRHGRHK